FEHSSGDEAHLHLISACWLPPEKSPERDRWVGPHVKRAAQLPKADYAHYWLGHAYYRAGPFAEAEASRRKAVQLSDALYILPPLGSAPLPPGPAGGGRARVTGGREAVGKDGEGGARGADTPPAAVVEHPAALPHHPSGGAGDDRREGPRRGPAGGVAARPRA